MSFGIPTPPYRSYRVPRVLKGLYTKGLHKKALDSGGQIWDGMGIERRWPMYSHHVEEMTQAVAAALEISPPETLEEAQELAKIKEAIQSCWKDKIAVSWCAEDIIERAKEHGNKITEEEALEVLNRLLHKFDANIGINWNVIDCWLGE
jgi:hypothetical protein